MEAQPIPSPEDQRFAKLIEDLHRKISQKAIVKCLKSIREALEDSSTFLTRTLIFLRMSGLPPLVRHITGITRTQVFQGVDVTTDPIAFAATEVLKALLTVVGQGRKLHVPADDIPPLLDAFRDAPTLHGRSMAVHVLLAVSDSQPDAIANAGIIGLVLHFYNDLAASPLEIWDVPPAVRLAGPACGLVNVLVSSVAAAQQDLRKALLSGESRQAFAALVLLQVRHPFSG
jgi:hypothetical protein